MPGFRVPPSGGSINSRFDLLSDYVALHPAKRSKKLVLLSRAHVEFVERFHQVLDQRIEVRIGDTHALMSCLHGLARVLAGPTRCLTNLVNQVHLELRKPLRVLGSVGKELVDSAVPGAVVYELIHHGGDGRLPTQPGVKRLLTHFPGGCDAETSPWPCPPDRGYHQTLTPKFRTLL